MRLDLDRCGVPPKAGKCNKISLSLSRSKALGKKNTIRKEGRASAKVIHKSFFFCFFLLFFVFVVVIEY